jgi:hypothetical protein
MTTTEEAIQQFKDLAKGLEETKTIPQGKCLHSIYHGSHVAPYNFFVVPNGFQVHITSIYGTEFLVHRGPEIDTSNVERLHKEAFNLKAKNLKKLNNLYVAYQRRSRTFVTGLHPFIEQVSPDGELFEQIMAMTADEKLDEVHETIKTQLQANIQAFTQALKRPCILSEITTYFTLLFYLIKVFHLNYNEQNILRGSRLLYQIATNPEEHEKLPLLTMSRVETLISNNEFRIYKPGNLCPNMKLSHGPKEGIPDPYRTKSIKYIYFFDTPTKMKKVYMGKDFDRNLDEFIQQLQDMGVRQATLVFYSCSILTQNVGAPMFFLDGCLNKFSPSFELNNKKKRRRSSFISHLEEGQLKIFEAMRYEDKSKRKDFLNDINAGSLYSLEESLQSFQFLPFCEAFLKTFKKYTPNKAFRKTFDALDRQQRINLSYENKYKIDEFLVNKQHAELNKKVIDLLKTDDYYLKFYYMILYQMIQEGVENHNKKPFEIDAKRLSPFLMTKSSYEFVKKESSKKQSFGVVKSSRSSVRSARSARLQRGRDYEQLYRSKFFNVVYIEPVTPCVILILNDYIDEKSGVIDIEKCYEDALAYKAKRRKSIIRPSVYVEIENENTKVINILEFLHSMVK